MSGNNNVERLAAAQQSDAWRPAPLDAPWPALRLSDAAFHSVLGRYVRKIEPHTEADLAGILVQLLVLFGNMVGRRAHFTVEADQHFTNLFAVLVGESSSGRKGVALGQAERLMRLVDKAWIDNRVVNGASSGEGLLYAVRDRVERNVTNEGRGSVSTAIDEGVDDKRLMVVEKEMASVLRIAKREGNILSSTLRNAWDSGDLRTLTKNAPTKATGAHISIISHITKPELLQHFDSIDASNGFGNRFLWCCVRRSKMLPEGGLSETLDFSAEVEDLRRAAAFARECGKLARDNEAKELWHATYGALTQDRPGIFGSIITRAAPQVMRLALIYAIVDQSTTIQRCHLEAALAVWRYCEDSACWIFGRSVGNTVADRIVNLLQVNPAGSSRTEISKAFQGHQTKEAIDRALERLKDAGRIAPEKKQGAGRTGEVWRLIT